MYIHNTCVALHDSTLPYDVYASFLVWTHTSIRRFITTSLLRLLHGRQHGIEWQWRWMYSTDRLRSGFSLFFHRRSHGSTGTDCNRPAALNSTCRWVLSGYSIFISTIARLQCQVAVTRVLEVLFARMGLGNGQEWDLETRWSRGGSAFLFVC